RPALTGERAWRAARRCARPLRAESPLCVESLCCVESSRTESQSSMNTAVASTRPAPVIRKPIRVMVVDDAIVVRRQLTRWIGDEKDMMVAACLRTGREAVEQLEGCNPDVVVLDVEMPELDGLSASPQRLKKKPDLVVIIASALTRRSAEISLRALSLGAADYVPKPEVALDADSSASFRRELLDKIRSLGRRGSLLLRQRRPATAPREVKLPRQRPS